VEPRKLTPQITLGLGAVVFVVAVIFLRGLWFLTRIKRWEQAKRYKVEVKARVLDESMERSIDLQLVDISNSGFRANVQDAHLQMTDSEWKEFTRFMMPTNELYADPHIVEWVRSKDGQIGYRFCFKDRQEARKWKRRVKAVAEAAKAEKAAKSA